MGLKKKEKEQNKLAAEAFVGAAENNPYLRGLFPEGELTTESVLPTVKAMGAKNMMSLMMQTNLLQTKAAVEGLTVTLAAEFAPHIRVNCIAPSLSKSKIAEPMLKNPTIAEGIAKAHPLKRLGEGKDSAALAKFLITEESSWITGQIIAVDGGRSKLS